MYVSHVAHCTPTGSKILERTLGGTLRQLHNLHELVYLPFWPY